ncbi:MAG: OmpA family protein [Pseudomonadota bacterium]
MNHRKADTAKIIRAQAQGWIFLAMYLTLAACSGAARAAELTEAEIIRQLLPRQTAPVAAADDKDPDAVFGNSGSQSKNLSRVRLPDTNGACLADEGSSSNQKNLGVVAIAPAGAPQVNLPLQFELAQYQLSPSDRQQLNILASAMNSVSLSDARFTIAGHTDASGDALINEKLSCARALSAYAHLIRQGVAANRLSAYGFGRSRPLVSGSTDAAQNRRVEIRRADN